MKPEWEPPVGFLDPLVRRIMARDLVPGNPNAGRARWSRIIRGRIPEFREIAVVRTLADYGNRDGTTCHPGVANLVEDVQSSDRTVRRSLGWLVEQGWLSMTHRGRRKLAEANVYSLAVPAPVAVILGVWGEEHGDQWLERPAGMPKRPDVAINSARRKPPFPPVIRDRKKPVLPVTDEVLAVMPAGSSGHSSDLPPGPEHQVLEEHHSASGPPSRASAREPIKWITTGLDPSDPELSELLLDRVEDFLGYALDVPASRRLEAMVAGGRRLEEIVAVAINDPGGG